MEVKNYKNLKKELIQIIIAFLILITVLLFITGCGCSAKKYIVEFDSNGGTSVESIEAKKNEKIKKPTDPTKQGYYFDGWYYNDKLFDFDTKITKNIQLQARWNSTNIELNSAKISLVIGTEEKLEILSLPKGVNKKDLIYSSSDESIVSVDENGLLKALRSGKVTITIKSKSGKYIASCVVTVTEEEIEIESISITGSNSVTVGNSIKLSVTIKPENATSQKLQWNSSDSKVATVDSNGNVVGVKPGVVTITVTANGKKASKKITVKEKTTSKDTLDTENKDDNNQGNTSSNENENDKDEENNKDNENEKPSEDETEEDKPTIPETIEPTKVKIDGPKQVYVEESIKLTATVEPDKASNKDVTWNSSNLKVATVDSNGNVIGITPGVVTITATTSNGKKATYEITVKETSYVIYLTKRELAVTGKTIQYDFRVEKNGVAFNDYLGFELGKTKVPIKTGSISSTVVEQGEKTAKLTLSNKKIVTATVLID